MWIFCCGMQRSGSTLQFQIVTRLVEEAGLGKRVEWTTARPITDRDLQWLVARSFDELRAEYADYRGWKVFRSHICTPAMIAEFADHNAIGVYSFRDLRDALVSAARMRNAPRLLTERWRCERFIDVSVQSFQAWTSLPRVLASRYEEMVTDLPGEVQRIATHLGLSLPRDECEAIASAYRKERQLQRIESAKEKWSVGEPFFDPDSLLHTNHIHLGEIGGWKRVLSADQLALIEDRARDWLVANGYELSLTFLQRKWLMLRHDQKRFLRAVKHRLSRAWAGIHKATRAG